MDLDIKNLAMYYEKAQSELHDFRRLFKINDFKDEVKAIMKPMNARVEKHDVRVHFEELCYTSKLSNEEVKKYIHFLKKRIRDIEGVIDMHFELIKKAIR